MSKRKNAPSESLPEGHIWIEEATQKLARSLASVRGYLSDGRLTGRKIKVGRSHKWAVERASVEAYIAEREPTSVHGDPQINAQVRRFMRARKNKRPSVVQIADALNLGPSTITQALEDLKRDGHNFQVQFGRVVLDPVVPVGGEVVLRHRADRYRKGREFKIGGISDNHYCNKHTRHDVVEALFDRYEAEDVDFVVHGGNMIDGEARFNKHELTVHGLDNQVDEFLHKWPQRTRSNGEPLVTYFVTGDDHEGWYQQREGINIGEHIQARAKALGREDLVFIGYGEGDLRFQSPDGNSKHDRSLRVIHAGGGSSYALSYTSQKYVESLQGGEKPAIVAIGHYHKFDLCYPREVWCLQLGCTCFTGNTFVRTPTGGQRIGNITVGDLVLTHQNRFRRVLRVMERPYVGEMIRINYGRKGRMDNQITSTPEHPILTIRPNGTAGWKEAKDVTCDDFVFVRAGECQQTGNPIPYWRTHDNTTNAMDNAHVRDAIADARGGRIVRRHKGGGDLRKHLENDILPMCNKLEDNGWTVVPVGGSVIPDIIGFKDNRVVAFEVEKTGGARLVFKQTKYEEEPILEYIDEVRWILPENEKRRVGGYYFVDEALPGFVAVPVVGVDTTWASASRDKTAPIAVYNLEVEEDNSYVASDVAVHNCDQTMFMRKKKLQAMVGGTIMRFRQAEHGELTQFSAEFLPFYDKGYYTEQGLWDDRGRLAPPPDERVVRM